MKMIVYFSLPNINVSKNAAPRFVWMTWIVGRGATAVGAAAKWRARVRAPTRTSALSVSAYGADKRSERSYKLRAEGRGRPEALSRPLARSLADDAASERRARSHACALFSTRLYASSSLNSNAQAITCCRHSRRFRLAQLAAASAVRNGGSTRVLDRNSGRQF